MKTKLLICLPLPVLVLACAGGCGSAVQAGPEPNMSVAMKIREGFKASTVGSKTGSAEAGGAELKRLEGWASVRGRFVVDGAPPAESKITPDKDLNVCGQHELFNESVVVKDKNLANVVIYVRTPKIPVHEDYKKSDKASVTLDNKGCRFEPHVMNVRVGQTLIVKNSDPVAHNTKIDGKNMQGNPLIPANSPVEFPIEAAEPAPVPVSCSIHPWMKARLVVTSNPYCSVSKGDGTFELKNVPAGDLELQVWQEAAGNVELSNPRLQKLGNGRYRISLQPKEELDLKDLVVSAAALKAG